MRLNTGHKFSLATGLIVALSMCVFWLISNQNTESVLRQQADSLGQALTRQTAILVTELVLANDLISMNVFLNQLTRDGAIAQAAVLDIDNRVLAIAGSAVTDRPVGGNGTTSNRLFGSYVAPIALQDSIAGYVKIDLDQSYIEESLNRNFLFILLATGLLLVMAVATIMLLAQHTIGYPLSVLAALLHRLSRGRLEHCPPVESDDEIGQLIVRYNSVVRALQDPENRSAWLAQNDPLRDFHARPGSATLSVLSLDAVDFSLLSGSMEPDEAVELLNRYYFYLHKVSHLYNGTVVHCTEENILITFGNSALDTSITGEDTADEQGVEKRSSADEHCFHAACCALLFLELTETLNDELYEQDTPVLQFRAGLHCGEVLTGVLSSLEKRTYTVSGKSLTIARQISAQSPPGGLVVSKDAYDLAGAPARLTATAYDDIIDAETGQLVPTFFIVEPAANYRALLTRQVDHLLSLNVTAEP